MNSGAYKDLSGLSAALEGKACIGKIQSNREESIFDPPVTGKYKKNFKFNF